MSGAFSIPTEFEEHLGVRQAARPSQERTEDVCPSEPRAADTGAPPPCLGLQGVRFGEQGEIKQLVFEIT